MDTHKLLPCGFCGLHPHLVTNTDYTKALSVECACGRRVHWSMDKDQVIEAWNFSFGLVPEARIVRVEE